MRDNDMPTFYRGINWIANTKFSINKPIMQVIEEVWRGGRDMLDIPATKPLEKEDMPRASAEVVADKDAFMVHKRNVALLYKDSQGRKGQRSIFSGALNITKAYEDESEFYFDQFCDFRGRVYPRGDYLNYTNEKWARAMLQFAKPVEPGEHGRRAARIWAANCYGVDKVSFADRERWTLDHSREIARCAAMGLDEDFWKKADSPWEFLAACHALTDDQQLARLPIGRDGTANGLQHLAAMTRDETLAPLVNLTAGDAPADLYTVCLREVERLLKEAGDIHVNKWVYAKRGHKKKVQYSVYVKDVLPWVKRSVCKQTFLAFAYGVTLSGAIHQVHSKMRKEGAEDCDDTHRIAMTLARACIQAIENIAKRPAAAMKWMQECARLVCNSGDKKTAMSWINGVNFLVEQPYRKKWKGRIQTIVGETHVQAEFDSYEVAVGRQVRGIAPNTVHSFDQEHLMRTACMMLRRGYEMFAQHDQYNCHAGHVAYMHREAIDQLAGMYEGVNRLVTLHEYWSKLVPGLELPQPPELGNFDPASIRESTYAFH
jgi:DNA-directed RNA polymerase